ncbi:MAG TPA: hypothetical protein VIK72_16020 [Clostridiaceae bacterium]
MKVELHDRVWFLLLMLIIFPPVGIFLLWSSNKVSKKVKVILSIISAAWFLFVLGNA